MMKVRLAIATVAILLASQAFPGLEGFLPAQERYPLFDEPTTLLESDSIFRPASSSIPGEEESFEYTGSLSASTVTPYPQTPAPPPPPPRTAGTKTPKQKGNSLITNRFAFQNSTYATVGWADYISVGRLFVGDNNSAETDNRLIFRHSYFKNALRSQLDDGAGTIYNRSDDVDQFLVGFEKTLDMAQQWSLEMRLPLYGANDPFYVDGFSMQSASVGNLAMILKRQIYQDDFRVLSTGLGVSVPTGDDTQFTAGEERFIIRNNATHLAPFVAGLWTPSPRWFYHGFMSVDLAANGNTLEYQDLLPCGCGGGWLGEFNDQALLNVDLAAGYWLFRCCEGESLVTEASTMLELHYTTALTDGDYLATSTAVNDVQFLTRGGPALDTINVTAGFDFNVLNTFNLRFAAVLPMQSDFDRFFDTEWQTSINFIR